MSYTTNNIQTLSFRDGVRARVQMYLESDGMAGVYNGIQEIISNSIDEHLMGYGSIIKIELLPNNQIRITDEARGVPFGKNTTSDNVLLDIYTKPHTGGKFDDKVYSGVAGLNGIGAKATALSSEFFQVESTRDGKTATLILEKGLFHDYQETQPKHKDGTIVTYTPDQEVYKLEPIDIKFEVLCEKCKNLSYLTKGLTFIVEMADRKEIFNAKEGLAKLVKDTVKPIHKSILTSELKTEAGSVEIALMWGTGKETSFTFTNGLLNSEGGTSLTGAKTALTRFFKKELKNADSLDIGLVTRKGLVYAISCMVANPSFSHQTKNKVNNPELNGLCQKAMTLALEDFAKKHQDELTNILEAMEKTGKAEQAAEKARATILNATKEIEKKSKMKVFASDKLKDARKLGNDSTLLIVEGNSALGSLAQARDVDKYGLLALRGKIINGLTHTPDKVLENEEVKLIFSALGISPNKSLPNKMRYGKVGIATDADSDGGHIMLLILSLFAEFAPQMLEQGRVYKLNSPTHLINTGKKSVYYYGKDDYLKNKVKGHTTHLKGLGELNADQIKESMFGDKQKLVPLTWDSITDKTLKELMGSDNTHRKKFLFNEVDFSTIID